MKQTIAVFSILIIAILALFQISKYGLVAGEAALEWLIAIIAVVFFGIGMYINKRSQRAHRKRGEIDHERLAALGISSREYEVLELMEAGHSNQEIAEKLHVSESTVKTHVSNILTKLNAKRRTQAVQIAKLEGIL